MEKDKCGTKFRLIHLGIILLAIFGSGVAAWVWQQAETKAIAKDTTTMKVEGCDPSQKNKFDIALIQKDISNIQKTQETIQSDQKAGFKEVLRRLPK